MGIPKEKFSFAGYFAKILQTKEVMNAVDSGITEVINLWGEGSSAKKFASKPAKCVIKNIFSNNTNGHKKEELLSLLKHPDLLELISSTMPTILNNISEIIHAMVVSLENNPEEKQLEMLSRFFSSFNTEQTGKTLTSLARILNSLHKNNPKLLADNIIPGLRTFLEHTDFSEFKNVFDHSKEDIDSILNGANDLAFEFPAKLVTFLSFLPGVSNHLLFFLEDIIKRFNDLPADILADILMSFFKEMDGKTIGNFINNINEMIRQVHTGSALIGEAGVPQFSTELLRKSRIMIEQIDPFVMMKAGRALLDGKEVLQKTFQQITGETPELLTGSLENLSAEKNSKIRLFKHKLETIEDLSEEDAAKALAKGISKWNGYDFAEVVNATSIILNSLNEHSPDVLKQSIEEFTATLDIDEIIESVSWISGDVSSSLKPFIRATAPVLIKEIIGCLSPDGDENDDQIDEAREMLRQFITGREKQ
jgi:hypothetical protein